MALQISQAIDFLDESNELYQLVESLSENDLQQKTAFKDWTINDVLSHLHIWNVAADLSLRDPVGFKAFFAQAEAVIKKNQCLKEFERVYLTTTGHELINLWKNAYVETAEHFLNADPKARVQWAGPSMSVRSSITARLMETWAHAQEVYDVLSVERKNTDRIKNIVILGINTFAYTYNVRNEKVPLSKPFVKLKAPSGASWTFGDENSEDQIQGLAEEFCQVVTQTRNISDTKLQLRGLIAEDWMSKAQCFAGAATEPPKPGQRKIKN